MAKVLRKLETGEEVKSFEIDTEIKTVTDFEGKALGELEIEIIGSTASSDRDGESIDQKGWDLKAFKKNPVILAQHNYSKPAIGRAKNVKVVDGKLMFKIEFPEDGINPEADVYRKLYKSGFMNASSVGFVPKEWEDGNGKKEPFRTYTKAELLELSLVSVPANSEAVVTTRGFVAKGIISEAEAALIDSDIEKTVLSEAVDPKVKDADPGYMYDNYIESHEEVHIELDKRLSFIEGFIAGIQKDASKAEEKHYIAKLLSGRAERTDSQTTEVDQVDIIKGLFGKE